MSSPPSINGWPVLNSRPSTFYIAPNGKHVYVANADLAVIFDDLTRRWHNEVTALPPATYNQAPNERAGLIVAHSWRPNNPGNTTQPSNHRSATAVDLNGHLHHYEPQCLNPQFPCGGPKNGQWHPGMSAALMGRVRSICARYRDDQGNSVIWSGLDFVNGRRDAMHVEVRNGVTAAQIKQAADRLRAHDPEAVKGVQTLLTDLGVAPLDVDGSPGSATQAAIAAYATDFNYTGSHTNWSSLITHLEATMGLMQEMAADIKAARVASEAAALDANRAWRVATTARTNATRAARTSELGWKVATQARNAIQDIFNARVPLSGSNAEVFGDSFRAGALLGYAARGGYGGGGNSSASQLAADSSAADAVAENAAAEIAITTEAALAADQAEDQELLAEADEEADT